MPEPTIVVPADSPPLYEDNIDIERLQAIGPLSIYYDLPLSQSILLSRVRSANIIVDSRPGLEWTRSTLEHLGETMLIVVAGVGTDHIDLAAASELGVSISTTPAVTAEIVAEHAVALMLDTVRRLRQLDDEVRRGRWHAVQPSTLVGKVLGVVGTGAIGSHVARLGNALGMEVVAWTFNPSSQREEELGLRYVQLPDLLDHADVVTLHLRLTDRTRRMFGKERLRRMKRGAILVNVARGELIDTEALAECLQDGHLSGAGIDVFEKEPPSSAHPLLKCPTAVLTPHCADWTPEGSRRLARRVAEIVEDFVSGPRI